MSNLLIILLVLFGAMAIILPIAERFGKPMEDGDAQKYSRIIMFLMMFLLLASGIKYFMS